MHGTEWLGSPAAVIAAAGFGAIWGSFYNVCIARIPRRQSVVRPASHCFGCGSAIRAIDNIPILSYVWLRGRCRSCGARFSPRYLLVEILTAIVSASIFWTFVAAAPDVPLGLRLARFALYFAFAGVLVVLSFIDLDTKRLPDIITLPSIMVLFAAAFGAQQVPWLERAIGVAAGYLVVRIIADGYYYLTGREGLGLGDGKLLALVGAVLGWKAIPPVIFFASFVGIFVSVPLILLARWRSARPEPHAPSGEGDAGDAVEAPSSSVRHVEVPFGPFLSLSALLYLLFSEPMWEWFLDRLGG